MILNNQRLGGCYLQNINEKTVQGSSDSGYYLTGYKYKFPKNLKTQWFFNFSKKKRGLILRKFLTQIKNKKKFKLKKFNENNSIFFQD